MPLPGAWAGLMGPVSVDDQHVIGKDLHCRVVLDASFDHRYYVQHDL